MKIFACPNCANTIFFENFFCEVCDTHLGFHSKNMEFVTMSYENSSRRSMKSTEGLPYCENHNLDLCNWVVEDKMDSFCVACKLNRKVPDSADTENFEKWKRLEKDKHRLVFQLLRLQLPLVPKSDDSENGLAFDFLSSDNPDGVLTGHSNGVVTIILAEADSVHRERLRKIMSEPYRTLLGHFRHEIGHYYWPLLEKNGLLDSYRLLFSDERLDYGEALKSYYEKGAPFGWRDNYISKYASAHSWEDWAETWAHYFHLMDTLETANGMKIAFAEKNGFREMPDPYAIADFSLIYENSVSLMCATNSLNRAMGLSDIYPFVISESVQKKLSFIHDFLYSMKGNFAH